MNVVRFTGKEDVSDGDEVLRRAVISASGDGIRTSDEAGDTSDAEAWALVEEAIAPDDIDRSAFEARLKEARDAVDRAEEDSEERSRAHREVKRYEAFLEVAGGS